MATRKHVTLRHIWDVEVDCLEAIDSEPRIGLCPFLSTARGQLTNCVRDRCRLWLALAEGGGECGFLSIAKESIPIRDATHAGMPFGATSRQVVYEGVITTGCVSVYACR